MRTDAAVVPANHETAIVAQPPAERRLAPPSRAAQEPAPQGERSTSAALRNISFGVPSQAIYTVVTALAIVIGAFLIFAWALRRGGKTSSRRRAALPAEVVSVLGRAPLAARQFAELLRVGNKLVLVAMTPTGPTTLTEVTDPLEVDRLVGMCQQFDANSTSKAFEEVFQQFSAEPVSGFLGNEALPASLSSAASAYRSHRGSSRA
jgi:flagellar biogenesis protein FliO